MTRRQFHMLAVFAVLWAALGVAFAAGPASRPVDPPADPAPVVTPVRAPFSWRLAPAYGAYGTEPKIEGIETLPVVYPASDTILDPLKPHLLCIAGARNVFVPADCRRIADYLKARGRTVGILDFEPDSHGDRAGWTPENVETCEAIVEEFKARGVTLHLYHMPPTPEGEAWAAKLNDGRLYVSYYAFGPTVELWRVKRLEHLAGLRRRHPGVEIVGWISPHFVGQNGEDDKPPVPFGTPVSPEMWDAMVRFVETYCDAGVVWATGMLPDGSGYREWDDKADWFKAMTHGTD